MRVIRQPSLFKGARKPLRIVGDGHDEHHHQKALVSFARDSARLQTDELKRDALLWFHSIPNGAFVHRSHEDRKGRAPLQALKLIAEGLTTGIWDLRLDYVVRTPEGLIICPGLIIEMKLPGNTLTPKQIEYGEFMAKLGFKRVVAPNWQIGARALIEFMELTEHAPVFG